MSKLIKVALMVSMLFAIGCANYKPASFKELQSAYDKPFEQVWAACLKAVDEQTIESADKTLRQIVTKPSAGMVGFGNSLKTTIIKVSDARPYRVRVQVLARHTSGTFSGYGAATAVSMNSTDDYSDATAEKKLIEKIEALLK